MCSASPAGDIGARGAGRRRRSRSVCALHSTLQTGRMRPAVRALLTCAVLGECGRWEGPQCRQPWPPCISEPSAPSLGSALELEAWDLSFASPRCTLAPASALPQGQLCACAHLLVLLVALPHSHSLLGFPSYPVNLVVAEYRKLERSRPGLSNPFVAASNKSKLLRMAIKAFPQLVPPPLTVRCPMSALGADRATLMRQTLMKGSEHGI